MHRSDFGNFIVLIAFAIGCGLAFSNQDWAIHPGYLLAVIPILWVIHQDVWPAMYSQIVYWVFFMGLAVVLGNCFMNLHLVKNDPDLSYENVAVQGKIREVKLKQDRTSLLMLKPTVTYSDGRTIKLKANLRLHCREKLPQLFYGQTVEICAQMRKIHPPLAQNQFDYFGYNRRYNVTQQGYFNSHDFNIRQFPHYLSFIRGLHVWTLNRLVQNSGSQTQAIVAAMLVGHRNGLDEQTHFIFNQSGALHILSVSGLHVGLIFGFMLSLIKYLLPPRRLLIILTQSGAIVLIWIFAALCGLEAPVVRSAFMLTLFTFGRWFFRQGSGINILLLVSWIMILTDPFIIFQISFQFTVLAMWGLLGFYNPIYHLLPASRYILIKYLWSMLAASLAAQVTIIPLLGYYFNQMAIYFWLSSILAIPATPLLLLSGIMLIIFPSSVWIQTITEIVTDLFMKWLKFCADLPLSVIQHFNFSLHQVLTWLFCLVIIYFLQSTWKTKSVIPLLLSALLFLSVTSYTIMQNSMPQMLIEYKNKKIEVTLSCGNESFLFDVNTGSLRKHGVPDSKEETLPEPFENSWLVKAGPYIQVKNKIICLFPQYQELDQHLPIDVLVHTDANLLTLNPVQYILTGKSTESDSAISWKLFEDGYKLIKF